MSKTGFCFSACVVTPGGCTFTKTLCFALPTNVLT